MRIGLIVTATGKYQCFVGDLWLSAKRFFMPGHETTLLLLTNSWPEPTDDIRVLHTEHLPWPGPTLRRYHHLLAYESVAEKFDYLFQCDADMRFVAPVGEEILARLVGTIHPGFFNKTNAHYSYERRRDSQAFIQIGQGEKYYAGGFQGGEASAFLSAAEQLAKQIDEDAAKGITAVWHDESQWNRYLFENPPDKELSPSYCYPEELELPFPRKLLALKKDHAAMRAG